MSLTSDRDRLYVYDRIAIYDIHRLRRDMREGKISAEMMRTPPSNALLYCDIDYEFDEILIGKGISLSNEVLAVDFPNSDRRIVFGHNLLRIALQQGREMIDVVVVSGVDMEEYRVQLPLGMSTQLSGSPHRQIITRAFIERAFKNTGYSHDIEIIDIAYSLNVLQIKQMYRASGEKIQAAQNSVDNLEYSNEKKFFIELKYEWNTFREKFEQLKNFTVGFDRPADIKISLRADPHMDRRQNQAAWDSRLVELCYNNRLLRAAYDQALAMQDASKFMGSRTQTHAKIIGEKKKTFRKYKNAKDFFERVALCEPTVSFKDAEKEAISIHGLTRIAILSGSNPANYWWSHDIDRYKLEFGCVVGRLFNGQEILLTPPVAEAAINTYERARDAFLNRTAKDHDEEDKAALMLIDLLRKTCDIPGFMNTAERVVTRRHPTRLPVGNDESPAEASG